MNFEVKCVEIVMSKCVKIVASEYDKVRIHERNLEMLKKLKLKNAELIVLR